MAGLADQLVGLIEIRLQAGVLEPAMSKIKGIQFATEAAITVSCSLTAALVCLHFRRRRDGRNISGTAHRRPHQT